jgi:predicted TIM-barrel fold metal-dependent hydrolase
VNRFEIRPHDADIYRKELTVWLPDKIFDAHVHVCLSEHIGPISEERFKENWALEVGIAQSWEQLASVNQALFPDQAVYSLAFGAVFREVDIAANNAYVLAGAAKSSNKAAALYVTIPEEPASLVAQALDRGFIGIKPYPELAPEGSTGPSIFDFLPHEHLGVLDERAGLLMLHLPRAGRLADQDNIRELLEINDRYPQIKIVVAHVGRSFCLPTAQRGLPYFADRPSIYFDTSANLNDEVFEYTISTVGSDRILYGTDLPITLMRGVREHVGETYINYTDEPFSWNTNRKPPEVEANYTFYLYEELRALIRAAQATGIGKDGLKKILWSNATKLIGGVDASEA